LSEPTAVSVNIRGKTFRIRSEQSPRALEEIAAYVDSTMQRVEQGTGAVDSLDVAMLTALNLAREVVAARGQAAPLAGARLRDLIDRAEAAVSEESP
jgi:cell division protein ZapA (FtsZ GTPase activity inhibitor)